MLILKKTAPSISLYLSAEERELLVEFGTELCPAEYSHREISAPSLNSMRPITRLLDSEDARFMKRSGASPEGIQGMLTARATIFRGYAQDLYREIARQDSERAATGSAPALQIYTHKARICWQMGRLIFAYGIRRISPKRAGRIVKAVFGELELEFRGPVVSIGTGR